MPMLIKETWIWNRHEEVDCWCGFPLYVGDRGFITGEGLVFCSKQCAREENAEETGGHNARTK